MTTKEKIIVSAFDLLLLKGYNAFSYNDLSSIVGIKTSSIHYYFPAKTDLVLSLINFGRDQQEFFLESISKSTPLDKLSHLIDFYIDLGKKKKMCPIMSITSDISLMKGTIQNEVEKFYDFLIGWLVKVLDEGKKIKQFYYNDDASVKAMQMLNQMAMIPMMSRIGKDTAALNGVKSLILNTIISC